MSDEYADIEKQLDRLEAKALLHGRSEAIDAEINALCRRLDELEAGAGEDWLMARDRELGRAFSQDSDVK
jgi:hypothetical protein